LEVKNKYQLISSIRRPLMKYVIISLLVGFAIIISGCDAQITGSNDPKTGDDDPITGCDDCEPPEESYSIVISITGREAGEDLTANIGSATPGTTISLTASLNPGRQVSMSTSGTNIAPDTVVNDGETASLFFHTAVYPHARNQSG
jgi:hypothetical protein